MKITKKFLGDYYTFEDDEVDFVTFHSWKDFFQYLYYYIKYAIIIFGVLIGLSWIIKLFQLLVFGKVL